MSFRQEPQKKEIPREMRISDEEIGLLKSAFSGNDKLLKLLRKIFLPQYDYDAPVGDNIDMWMMCQLDGISPEESIVNVKAYKLLINQIEISLRGIKILVGSKEESVEDAKKRLQQNSTQ